MKIATLNIDWAGKAKSKKHYLKIEQFLNNLDLDFLVITEGIHLNFPNFTFKYFSEQMPEDIVFEGLSYSDYLNGEKAFRTIIYSKIECKKWYEVRNVKTNLALEFETELGLIVLYTTIIGTWFKKLPFAKQELENCIADCKEIYKTNQNLFIIGDLNTSFLENEKDFTINEETTESLKALFQDLNLKNATKNITENIDHIIVPKVFEKRISKQGVFVEKNVLSDHKGVFVELNVLR